MTGPIIGGAGAIVKFITGPDGVRREFVPPVTFSAGDEVTFGADSITVNGWTYIALEPKDAQRMAEVYAESRERPPLQPQERWGSDGAK